MKNENTIEIPEGVEAEVIGNMIKVKSGESELARIFPRRSLNIAADNKTIHLKTKFQSSKTNALIGTFTAHINNMFNGLNEHFSYKLKVCSIHFPMSVKVTPTHVEISNFLGEKKPRSIKLHPGVDVKVEGDVITVSAPNIEHAGLMATRIEQATRIRRRDRRIFQDGVFMIEKPGRVIK